MNDRKESPKRKNHHKQSSQEKKKQPEPYKGTDSKEETDKPNSDEIEAGYRESDEDEPE